MSVDVGALKQGEHLGEHAQSAVDVLVGEDVTHLPEQLVSSYGDGGDDLPLGRCD